MSSGETIAAIYFGIGLLTAAALLLWSRKEGMRVPNFLSAIVFAGPIFWILATAIVVWPLVLIGLMICRIDEHSTRERRDDVGRKNA